MWQAIGAIAAGISSLAALFTVRLLIRHRREEQENRRPYFIIKEPGLKKLSNGMRAQITFINVGARSAIDLKGRILFIDSGFDRSKEKEINFSISNDIPPGSPTPWYNDSIQLPNNCPPQYIYCEVQYTDLFSTSATHSQCFYMKWTGAKGGVTHPDFIHASEDEKAEIIKYLD